MANGITKEIIIPSTDVFDEKFNKLYDYYDLRNPNEIYGFAKLHEGLIEGLIIVKSIITKYFPNENCVLEFNEDPESKSLNHINVILKDEGNFEKSDLEKFNTIDCEIIHSNDLSVDIHSLIIVGY